MKRLLILLVCFISGISLFAQKCIDLFPERDRVILEYKKYTGADSLVGIVLYKTFLSNEKLSVEFIIEDADEKILDNGYLNSYCENGNYYLNIMNHVSMVAGYYNKNNEYLGDFLDYPNTFDPDKVAVGNRDLRGAQFLIKNKQTNQTILSVKISDRIYEKNEKVNTPLGNFTAAKVTFNSEVTLNGNTTLYRCIEWYAPDLGIIRSELYNKGVLSFYTTLSARRGAGRK